MQTKILNFRKTKHLMLRQWERGITDPFLTEVLCKHNSNNQSEKLNLIISDCFRKMLEAKNYIIKKETKGNWIVVIKEDLIITAYFFAYPNFKTFMDTHKNQPIKIL
jgi:hypothetical protein